LGGGHVASRLGQGPDLVLNWDDPRLARLERAGAAAWIWDPRRRRIVWATDEAALLWGLDDSFMLLDRPFGASDPSALDLDLAASALAHTQGVDTEIRLVHSGRSRVIAVMARRFARTDAGDLVLFTPEPRAANGDLGQAHPIAPLFNPFPLGLALFSPVGQLLYGNPVFERLIGRGRSATLADLAGSRKGAERFIRALLAAGSLRVTPTLVVDGAELTLQIDAAIAEDPRSKRSAFLVEVHDVTARRARERMLAERQILLRDLLAQAIEGWAVLDRRERLVAFGGRLFEDSPGADGALGLAWREAAAIFALSGEGAHGLAALAREQRRTSVRVAHESATLEAHEALADDGEHTGYHVFLRTALAAQETAPRKAEGGLLDLELLPILAHDNFEIIYANARAAHLFGVAEPAELFTRPFLDLFPEDERRASRHYDELGREPGATFSTRLIARTASGERRHLDAVFRGANIGGRRLVIAGLNDITPLMEAEESEGKEREENAPLFELAPHALVLVDRHGRIARTNLEATRLLGLSEGEILERPFEELIDKADRTAFEIRRTAAHVLATDEVSVLELRLRTKSGAAAATSLKMRALLHLEGALLLSLTDLEPQKAQEAELRRSVDAVEERNRQKTNFLSSVSHEMRTPLNAIIGFSEFMREGRLGPIGNEKYAGYVNDIWMSGQHLLSLVNDLLDMSKIEAGRMDLSFAPVDVASIIEQALRILSPQAEKKGVVLAGSFARNLPKVMADARSVRQIVINLLSNAVKFTPGTGRVVARAGFDPARGVTIEIEDTGVGMSEEEVKTALEPYRQVHGRAANDELGTGLGLPLAKALAEANHASFRIASVRDQGTRVEILFPASQILAEGASGA
jgi:PAS domain S-box-containing protein